MGAPLARFLAEFSDYKPAEPPADEPDVEMEAPEPLPEPVPTEPVLTLTVASIAHALQGARETSAAAERERLEAIMEERLAAQRDEMNLAHEQAREAWVEQEGQRISASLAEATARFASELAEGAGNALRPLFSEAVREKILAEMRGALGQLLGDPAHPAIRIEGPADLLTAFGKTQAGDVSIDYVESDQAELTIVTDQTRIESCFRACLSAFQLSEG